MCGVGSFDSNIILDNNYCPQHKVRLEPGQALTFNNRRCVHGRTAIKLNGGKRYLQVSYIIYHSKRRCIFPLLALAPLVFLTPSLTLY